MLLFNFNAGFQNNAYPSAAKKMNGSNNSQVPLNSLSNTNIDNHYGGTGTGAYCIVIGAGDTAVTKEDYDLADTSIMANDKMKSRNQTATYSKASGAVITCQWTNNSNEPITVKEMGLAFKLQSYAYDKASNILVARKVLTTPVTVQSGETYAFTYNIKV